MFKFHSFEFRIVSFNVNVHCMMCIIHLSRVFMFSYWTWQMILVIVPDPFWWKNIKHAKSLTFQKELWWSLCAKRTNSCDLIQFILFQLKFLRLEWCEAIPLNTATWNIICNTVECVCSYVWYVYIHRIFMWWSLWKHIQFGIYLCENFKVYWYFLVIFRVQMSWVIHQTILKIWNSHCFAPMIFDVSTLLFDICWFVNEYDW